MDYRFNNKVLIVNINRIIWHKGLKKGAVAKDSGFSPQQFSDMLNGRKVIRAEYIPAIAHALSASIDDLYAGMEIEKHDI